MDKHATTGNSAGAVPYRFREVMASVPTPVSVVTAMSGDRPHGTTVSAFASLSMTPPMILVSLDRGSELLGIVRETLTFGVNILGATQSAVALRFATKGSDKFNGIPWAPVDGLPYLDGAIGYLACRVAEFVDGGDHIILLGHIERALRNEGAPLTYHAREFGTHRPHAPH